MTRSYPEPPRYYPPAPIPERNHPEAPPDTSWTKTRHVRDDDPLSAVRGVLLGLAWSCAFWLFAVILPIAWHNGWRP